MNNSLTCQGKLGTPRCKAHNVAYPTMDLVQNGHQGLKTIP
jgi:hypothetical protein